MNKRLRKKKQIGEFTLIGLEVRAMFAAGTGFESFIDQFLEYIEANSFCFGGGGSVESFSGFLLHDKKHIVHGRERISHISFTKEDQEVVVKFLQNHRAVSSYGTVLVDSNKNWDETEESIDLIQKLL